MPQNLFPDPGKMPESVKTDVSFLNDPFYTQSVVLLRILFQILLKRLL